MTDHSTFVTVPGMDAIIRPSLILDMDKTIRNVAFMCQKAAAHQLLFRPHFKTHQSAAIAELFRPHGIRAATVSSLAMAHYFKRNGWQDLTVAIPHNPRETVTVNTEFSSQTQLGLLVDHPDTIAHLNRYLNRPLPVWIKIDCGLQRCGLPWDDEAGAEKMIRSISNAPKLKLRGLLIHAGHSYAARSREEVLTVHQLQLDHIRHSRSLFSSLGCPDLTVSAGDTPCMTLGNDFNGIDEIRPGNFVFFDSDQLFRQVCNWQDIALTVACPIIGIYPKRNQVLIHGGAVHLSKEHRQDPLGRTSYGKIIFYENKGWTEPEDADLTGLTQEHGIITFHKRIDKRVKIGGLIGILPIHSCLAVTPFTRYHQQHGPQLGKIGFLE